MYTELPTRSNFSSASSSDTTSDDEANRLNEDKLEADDGNSSEDKLEQAFWQRVSELTARTRTDDGRWVGSEELREWNARHTESCDRCRGARIWKPCIVHDDQPTCRPCRTSKMACDRKVKFVFEYTKHHFFADMSEFLRVYRKKERANCKPYRKQAVKKLRDSMPYGHEERVPKKRAELGNVPAVMVRSVSPSYAGVPTHNLDSRQL
ncbi:hypothetical protein R3P38DRAFT_3203038 [Favolaschia claudopus]|uniref:Zn(2)-C6 fungal-type domain-containing protein n=2 Tax=Favolaschia claudopus TaxID=2862362 RepID=A0AAW0AVT1_9AGAR